MSASRLMALLALAACSGGGETQKTETETPAHKGPEQRDTLVIAYQSDMGNLIPVVSESAADSTIEALIYAKMVDSEFDCSLKYKPEVATSWNWSDDGKTISMELSDAYSWADGTKITAKDVAFAYQLIADKTVASPRISAVEYMVKDAMPKVIDDRHIEWQFTKAYDRDTQLAHASMGLIAAHIYKDADRGSLRKHPTAKSPMSSGPWRLSKHEPNSRIVLEANPGFTGPDHFRPQLKRVIFRIIPEYNTRLLELRAGKVDMMQSILVKDADVLRKENPEIKLVRRGWRSNDYVAWNMNRPIFQDKRVRQAMAHATDIDAMIAKLLTSETGEKYARYSVGTITPALCGAHNDDIKRYKYDVAQAKKLLAEAGWTDTDGDGFVDKDGKKFSFTLSTNTGNKRRGQAAIILQAQLKTIGIDCQIERIEANAFFENLRKKDYDAALAGWSAGLFIDPSAIWHCDTEDKQYPFNFTSYCNPEVDALIEKGMNTPNPADAAPVWKEMQAKIYEDQPYMFLWWMDEIVGIHERFDGAEDNINILSPLNHLNEWSVPKNKVKYKR